MVRLHRMVVVAFFVCAGLVASTTPAQAVTFLGSCPGNNYLTIWLDATASYSVNGVWHNWYDVGGAIRNNPFGQDGGLGNQNNVDLYLFQDGAQNWAAFSPDNIHPGDGFSRNPNRSLPEWSNVQARVIGIFDKPFATDPQCPWWSPMT